MCDYSLERVNSRPAKVGDKLTTHNFGSTVGFRASSDRALVSMATAVCVLPGTELSFAGPIQIRGTVTPTSVLADKIKRFFGFAPKRVERAATFVQTNQNNLHTHHDAVRFADEEVVLLNDLKPGQEATVLTLPAKPRSKTQAKQQHSAELV